MQRTISVCMAVLACLSSAPLFAAPPSVPQNVRPAWLSAPYPATQAFAIWEPVPEASSYNIYRSHEGEPGWTLIATNVTQPFYADMFYSFLPSYYSVTAVNGEGESAGSEAVVVTEQYGSTITYPGVRFEYGQPINAFVEWTVTAVDGDEGMVEWGASYSGETNYLFHLINTNYLPGHSFQLTNLAPLTTYQYRLTTISTNRGGLQFWGSFLTPDTNHPPVLYSEIYTMPTDNGTSASITYWATDPDVLFSPIYQTIAYRLDASPTNGFLYGPYWGWRLDIGLYELYTYVSVPYARGTDRFTIIANDGYADSVPYTVTVTNWWNTVPAGGYSEFTAVEDTAFTVPLSLDDSEGDFVTYFDISCWGGTVAGVPPNLVFTPETNRNDPAWVYYSVTDGYGTNNGWVQINITPVNDKPVIWTNDLPPIETYEDQSVYLPLWVFDVDGFYGGELVQVAGPANGSLSGDAVSAIYTPTPNFFGVDTFTIAVREADGTTSDSATFSVTVLPSNDPPTVFGQHVTVAEDSTNIIVAAGADVENTALTFQIAYYPTNGSVSISGGTNITYQPDPNFTGADAFAITAFDADGGSSVTVAWVTIDVLPINDVPVAIGTIRETFEDAPVAITLGGNDVEAGDLSFVITSAAAHGTISGTPPNVTYTPEPNFNGVDSFKFVVQDGATSSAPASVTIAVIPVNDAPSAAAQSVSIAEDDSIALVVAGSDVEGSVLAFEVLSGPLHGSLSGTAPNLVYTPQPNFNGTDSFQFISHDGTTNSAPAIVTISVTPVNDAPSATAQAASGSEDGSVAITLGGSDIDADALTFSVVAGPSRGTLTGTAPNLVYTPEPNFNGPDSFTFVAQDGTTNSVAATVTISVNPMNDAPSATAQGVTLAEDGSVGITLTGTDIDADALTFSVVSGPTRGTLSGTAPNLVYTPEPNFNGTDSFTFVAQDGTTTSAAATISITVNPVNDAPSAMAQTVSLAEDGLAAITLAGTDIDAEVLTFSVLSGPTHGTLSGTASNLVYTPQPNFNGSDLFTFVANDGSAASAAATVSITVNPVNDAPSATAQAVSLSEDGSIAITLAGADIDGDALAFSVVSGPTRGSLTGTAPNLVYTPESNFNGSDSFTFIANDGAVASSAAAISITVAAANDLPVATGQSVSLAEDSSAAVTLSASDIDGDSLSYSIVQAPEHGTLTGSGASLTYTPNANFNGTDSFSFVANDGSGNGNAAVVSIEVTTMNDSPVANGQAVTVSYNGSQSIVLTGNDVEGSALAFSIVSGPTHGTLTGTAPNLSYTPAISYSGPDSFTFTVSDGGAVSAVATVSITVSAPTGVPAAPVSLTAIAPATSTGTINLAWSHSGTLEDGFKIERSSDSRTWTQIATVGPNVLTYTNGGLARNKTFYYRVRAYNALGNSAYSNTSSAKTR